MYLAMFTDLTRTQHLDWVISPSWVQNCFFFYFKYFQPAVYSCFGCQQQVSLVCTNHYIGISHVNTTGCSGPIWIRLWTNSGPVLWFWTMLVSKIKMSDLWSLSFYHQWPQGVSAFAGASTDPVKWSSLHW